MEKADVQQKIGVLREWFNNQPHYPQLEDKLILRFLHSCYYDIDKTKKCIDLFFSIRSSSPEIIGKRDPKSKELQKFLKIVNVCRLKISGNRNLWVWQLNEPGLETYDYTMDAKVFFLCGDSWILEDDFLEESDIVIMDVKDISLKFITKFNLSVARKMSKYQQEAMPIRLKEVHVVNAPSFIDKVYALIKPLMKSEFNQMIHFHKPKSDSLYNFVSKEELPDDFGGSRGKLDDLMVESVENLMKHREMLITDLWTIDESKRSKDSKRNESSTSTASVSFRSLAID